MNTKPQKRHPTLEDYFFSVLTGDQTAVFPSYVAWSIIESDLIYAAQPEDVTGSMANANAMVHRGTIITENYLDLKRKTNVLSSQLQMDWDRIFTGMSNLKISISDSTNEIPRLRSPSPSTASRRSFHTALPQFIPLAYEWLLKHLHNPYPSTGVKRGIASSSGCSINSVNAWFTNVRRRMGWTSLSRNYFYSCRADTVDAAHRVFVEEDPMRPLAPEVMHAFMEMKVTAEGLYSSIFSESALARSLDITVKDMKENRRSQIELTLFGKEHDESHHKNMVRLEPSRTHLRGSEDKAVKQREEPVKGRSCQVEQTNLTKTVQDSYPSPSPSLQASPVPTLENSLIDESEEGDDTPSVVTGFKRSRSSIEPDDQLPSSGRWPMKRLRPSSVSQTYLPSPPTSTDGIEESSDYEAPPEKNTMLSCRKRRFSGVDTTVLTESTRDSMPSPRPHVAPDPLPHLSVENEYSINDWLNANLDTLFAIPPPVDATELDISALWEVELLTDHDISRVSKHAQKYPPAPRDTSDLPDLDLLQSIGVDTTVLTEHTPHSMPSPPPHVVSDPPPCPSAEKEYSNDWSDANFDALFAIPPPVDAIEPDFSAAWEVELFKDYNIPGVSKHIPKFPSTLTTDTQISIPIDLPDLDSLLRSIGGDT